jgi:hypothetical protein
MQFNNCSSSVDHWLYLSQFKNHRLSLSTQPSEQADRMFQSSGQHSCIWVGKVRIKASTRGSDILTEDVHVPPQYHQKSTPRSFTSTTFQILYSLIILSTDVINSKRLIIDVK